MTTLPTAPRRRALRMLWLALLPLMLGWQFPAAAQDLQARAESWGASHAERSESGVPSPSFELTAVHGRSPSLMAPQSTFNGRTSTELAGVNARLWMSHGRTDLGVGLGMQGRLLPTADGPSALVAAVPAVTLGMRYRMSEQHVLYADASGVRGQGVDLASARLATDVGVAWKPASSTLGFEHRAIGVTLESGARLSLRSRRGGAAVYLRNTF